jgi:hypothetical protein
MNVKILEIRDSNTFIPMLCIDMNPVGVASAWEAQRYLLRRCGYPCDGNPNIAMTPLDAGGRPCWNDPYGWRDRTFKVAHNYIYENWHSLKDGDVVDVEFILAETTKPKQSERETVPF